MALTEPEGLGQPPPRPAISSRAISPLGITYRKASCLHRLEAGHEPVSEQVCRIDDGRYRVEILWFNGHMKEFSEGVDPILDRARLEAVIDLAETLQALGDASGRELIVTDIYRSLHVGRSQK